MLNYKKGENPNVDIVVDWLIKEALTDECLAPHLEKLDVKGMWNYITSQARKQFVGGCAMIQDDVVFGWAKHFALEDGKIEEEKITKPAKPIKEKKEEIELDMDADNLEDDSDEVEAVADQEVKPVQKESKPKKTDAYGGMSLFDL